MFYVGMAVAKATLACCLLSPDTDQVQRSFSNNRTGFNALLTWLRERAIAFDQVQIVMAATGVYHPAAALHLHEAGVQVAIVNPAQVKDFGKGWAVRTKTDRMDSWVLARFGQVNTPTPWQPLSVEVRELQALLARQRALAEDLQRERNRLEKADATLTRRWYTSPDRTASRSSASSSNVCSATSTIILIGIRVCVKTARYWKAFPPSARRPENTGWRYCMPITLSAPNTPRPISAWCPSNANPAPRYTATRVYRKRVPRTYVPSSTWQPSSPPVTTHT